MTFLRHENTTNFACKFTHFVLLSSKSVYICLNSPFFILQLLSAIEGLFEAKCPSVFESASLSTYYESFEADSNSFSGYRVKDTDPFCGRYALKNPRRIFIKPEDDLGIMLSSYGTVKTKNKCILSCTFIDIMHMCAAKNEKQML